MRVSVQSSADELATVAGGLLRNDAVNNTSLLSALAAEDARSEPWWSAVALTLRGDAAACALRDRAAVFISTGTPRAARALGRALRSASWQQSIVGPADMANECARALGLPARTQFELLLHALSGPAQPAEPPATGRMRVAHMDDLDLLLRWAAAFRNDAGLSESEQEARQRLTRQLQQDRLRLWLDEAECPRSFAGFTPVPPTGARVAPVYTPPEARGRGYAQALVVALCTELQAAGARSICLFTDSRNPTSNALYRRIGFAPVGRHLHLIVTRSEELGRVPAEGLEPPTFGLQNRCSTS
jgi:predicted GNAT family acetyltransferase